MALQDLIFTKEEEGVYVSSPVQLKDNIGIHIELPKATNNMVSGNTVSIFQSMTDTEYALTSFNNYVGNVFDRVLTGALTGMYIKIQCNQMPLVAKILIP